MYYIAYSEEAGIMKQSLPYPFRWLAEWKANRMRKSGKYICVWTFWQKR